MTHPDFQKIFGQPAVPSTSIVFGEKGSGKTAMRLMMERRFEAHNATHDSDRVWMIRYDDLNPFLDQTFAHGQASRIRKAASIISDWQIIRMPSSASQ